MGRVQADDELAFETLYDRLGSSARAVAQTVCGNQGRAEEAVQEGFLSMWLSRAGYRESSGSVRSWAMTIVRRRAIDLARRNHRADHAEIAGPRPLEGVQAPGDLANDHEARCEADALRATIARLPEPQAEVLVLAFYGGLTHTEIAKRLDLAPGTVKGRMRLGLKKLRPPADAESPRDADEPGDQDGRALRLRAGAETAPGAHAPRPTA